VRADKAGFTSPIFAVYDSEQFHQLPVVSSQ